MPTYDNYKQCSATTGWPWRKLKLAKALGADGFVGNRIQWEKFQAWYAVETNKNKIDSAFSSKDSAITIDDVKLSIARKDDILRELEIKKKRGEYLDPKEVNDFLLKLRLAFESTVKGWAGEIPAKLVGKTQAEIEYEIKSEVTNLLSNFGNSIKEQMNKCSQK